MLLGANGPSATRTLHVVCGRRSGCNHRNPVSFFPACYAHAKSFNFVLKCRDAAYTNRNAFYGCTACTNVGRFSRSWGVRFDQRGTGRHDFGRFSNDERLLNARMRLKTTFVTQ